MFSSWGKAGVLEMSNAQVLELNDRRENIQSANRARVRAALAQASSR